MQIHPSQISPAEDFDIFYFIGDPNDSNTYFIQAKIYDLQTGDVLDTVNLDESANNSRLFIKRVQAPPDPVGIGRNIVAIATVYTDSGYTTKSINYPENAQYFLIRHQNEILGGGMVDYRQIAETIEEALEKRFNAFPPPDKVKIPEYPFDSLLRAIEAIHGELNRVPKEIPPTKEVDLQPIIKAQSELKKEISLINNKYKADLTSLRTTLETFITDFTKTSLTELIRGMRLDTSRASDALISKQEKIMKDLRPEILEFFKKAAKDIIEKKEFDIPIPISSFIRPKEKEPEKFEISKLYSTR